MKVTLSDGSVAYLPGPGHIDHFAAAEPPEGYLVCNGGAVKRASFPELFAVIGTTFGAGDGSTTFNLPNGYDKFFIGSGSSYALATTGGEATHKLTVNEIPSHNHGLILSGGSTSGTIALNYVSATAIQTVAYLSNSVGGGGAHNNLPPYLGVLPCIKY